MKELLALLADRESKHDVFRAAESRADAAKRPGEKARADDELNEAHRTCEIAYGVLQDWFADPENLDALLAYLRAHPAPEKP